MAELTLTAFLTLDGVMQAPGGPNEDTSGGFAHGGWLVPYADADMGQFMVEVLARADAFMLGRGTYEIFAAHWPRVTDPADSIATALNGLPKYVASKTLERADWQGTTVIRDVAGEIARLKPQYPREIQVHGSPGLAQTLLAKDLVDVYHLLHFPLVLGSGKRLFGAGTVPAGLKLAATQTTSTGVVISTYQRAGSPAYGSFEVDEQPRFWD
ncbi:MAG: dihydrofolate reductase family protein [Rhodoferax sp.]